MIEVCKNLRTIYQGSRSSWEDQEDQENHDLLVVESPPQLRTIKVKWPDIEMRPIQKRTLPQLSLHAILSVEGESSSFFFEKACSMFRAR